MSRQRSSVLLAAYLYSATIVSVGSMAAAAEKSERVVESGRSDASRAISFELDVMPVLTAHGCNTGACHGKQRGQNGFQLSLLGFDPDFDFLAITQHARGRRVFPAAPTESLLLKKATAAVPHGGGLKIAPGSADYRTLLLWVEQGLQRKIAGEPELQSVEIAESSFVLQPLQAQPLSVTAAYSDGSRRDVTDWATYLSNNSAVASVDGQGVIEAGTLPGETAVMVRFMNHIRVASIVVASEHDVEPGYFANLPRNNFIDELIYKKLERTGVRPSGPCDDATFLRRACTDIIGRFPTVAQAQQFLSSTHPERREDLVDQLLASREYVDHWSGYWADLLRPNPYRVGIKAVLNYDNWIREQFRQEVRYDEFVRRLIAAEGSTWRNGAVTLFRDRRTPDEMATLVSQLFLGVRLECAKCHHHPFENWSQRDFYSFAAYFARVKHKGTGLSPPISGGEETVYSGSSGEVRHPISGEVLKPRPLFTIDGVPADGDDRRRQQLAAWMTSKKNPYFAQVQVNRIWAVLMGRGLVDPVDDLRSTNPATNPELLQALAQNFQDADYDLKSLIKTIVLSQAYARSSIPNQSNEADLLNYSRHYRHRFRAEVLLDSIALITETPNDLPATPPGARANQVWTHRADSMFLDTFGRPDENQDPPCERVPDSTVTQALHLMNSSELDRRIHSDQGRGARLAESEMSESEVVTELYLAIYSRYPSSSESDVAAAYLSENRSNRREAVEDLMWAMMNAPECVIQN